MTFRTNDFSLAEDSRAMEIRSSGSFLEGNAKGCVILAVKKFFFIYMSGYH